MPRRCRATLLGVFCLGSIRFVLDDNHGLLKSASTILASSPPRHLSPRFPAFLKPEQATAGPAIALLLRFLQAVRRQLERLPGNAPVVRSGGGGLL